MKKYMMVILLAFVVPAMAAETDAKSDLDRYVADDLAIQTLPNGEVVTRLVSRSGLSAQQFWTNSVYNPQGVIVVFQGRSEPTHNTSAAHGGQKYERQISPKDPALNGGRDILIQAFGAEHIQYR